MDEPIRESGPHLAGILRDVLGGDGPLYRQLSDGLKRAVDRGEIPLGTVLPPERILAKSLAVSRATVVAAYDRLKSEGWLESRQGSGTWVRRPEGEDRGGVDAVATARLFLSEDKADQRSGPGEAHTVDDVIDLTVAAVTASPLVLETITSVPAEEIAALLTHHGYVPHGLLALRQALAQRYTVAGLPSGEDQIVITTGAHQGISLVARQTLQRGDTVLVESPAFPGALDIFRRFGARMVPLPVDEDGARTQLLPELVAQTQPKLIYLAPHFHSPTGAVLPEARRRALAELADDSGIVVLEDLAMGDIDLDGTPLPPPIAAYSNGEGAIHTIGSTAKLFWAGLRIGWVRSPSSWSVRMLATKTVADLGSPMISQLHAYRLLQRADEVLAERREELIPQRDLLCHLLADHLPTWRWRTPGGGLSVWVTLPSGNAEEFAELALRHGVSVVPGPSLSVDEGNRRGLRVVFARPEPTLREGVRRLSAAWHAYEPLASRAPARLLV